MGSWLLVYEVWRCPSLRGPPRSEAGPQHRFWSRGRLRFDLDWNLSRAMTLRLRDNWLWDFWHVWQGEDCHLFYLQAPRSLSSEELRHHHATIGHAISRDLKNWTVIDDALHPGADGDWDDLATWTGSVIGHQGRWFMLYSGVNRSEAGLIQRIGLATSADLYMWEKHPANPILEADARWYEVLDLTTWYEQAWRDPWLFQDESDGSFHALITARSRLGAPDTRGVIGHARSLNLRDWDILPPLATPGGFGHLEVPQLVHASDRFFLLFSYGSQDLTRSRLDRSEKRATTGTYCLVSDQALGPFNFSSGGRLAVDTIGSHYGGKLIEDRSGRLQFLAFSMVGRDGRFIGELTDPFPVTLDSGLPEVGILSDDGGRPSEHSDEAKGFG